jgi:hypothetical protein
VVTESVSQVARKPSRVRRAGRSIIHLEDCLRQTKRQSPCIHARTGWYQSPGADPRASMPARIDIRDEALGALHPHLATCPVTLGARVESRRLLPGCRRTRCGADGLALQSGQSWM